MNSKIEVSVSSISIKKWGKFFSKLTPVLVFHTNPGEVTGNIKHKNLK
jgi:hypothetical protein